MKHAFLWPVARPTSQGDRTKPIRLNTIPAFSPVIMNMFKSTDLEGYRLIPYIEQQENTVKPEPRPHFVRYTEAVLIKQCIRCEQWTVTPSNILNEDDTRNNKCHIINCARFDIGLVFLQFDSISDLRPCQWDHQTIDPVPVTQPKIYAS